MITPLMYNANHQRHARAAADKRLAGCAVSFCEAALRVKCFLCCPLVSSGDEFIEEPISTAHWQDGEWRMVLKLIWERGRKRKLQRLSRHVIRWLNETAPSKLGKNARQPPIGHLVA